MMVLLFLRVCSTNLENTVGKGEISHQEQFLLFPYCFSSLVKNFPLCISNLELLCAKSLSFEQPKIGQLGKG